MFHFSRIPIICIIESDYPVVKIDRKGNIYMLGTISKESYSNFLDW